MLTRVARQRVVFLFFIELLNYTIVHVPKESIFCPMYDAVYVDSVQGSWNFLYQCGFHHLKN